MEPILIFLAVVIILAMGLGATDLVLSHARRFMEDRHRHRLELMEAQQKLEDAKIRNLEVQERILLRDLEHRHLLEERKSNGH